MGTYASRRSEVKNLAFAFVVAIVASLLVWLPSWNSDEAFATGDLGYASEIDYFGDFNGSTSYASVSAEVIPTTNGDPFTVEAWVSVSGQATDWQAIANQNQDGSTTQGFFFGFVEWSDTICSCCLGF